MSVSVELTDGKRFDVPPGVTLLDAAQAAGLTLPHSCRNGRCSSCKVRVLSGSTRPLQADAVLSADERAAGWALTCTDTCDAPVSLAARDLAELAGLKLLTLPARIDSLTLLAPDVMQVRLRLPPNNGLRYLPGQFVELIGPNGVRRAYSVANASAAQGLELQVRRVPGGAMSQYLFEQAKANDLVRLQGPRGSFHLGEVAGLHLVWLATGTGIAPFKAMLEGLASQPEATWPARIDLYWGNRVPQDAYWQPAPGTLAGRLGLHTVCSRAEADWTGLRGHVHIHALEKEGRDAASLRVFACGSPAMIASAQAAYAAWGLSDAHFHADAFVPSGGA
jgi:CDP-4-dehydro-6-deoxyglucose reductase